MSIYYDKNFRFLCVDPGLRGCGIAEFEGGDLVHAKYVRNPVESGNDYTATARMGEAVYLDCSLFQPNRVIIEHPRIYPGTSQQKGDLNDLLCLSGVGAAIATSFNASYTETVYPSDWKGNVEKEVMTARISRAISNSERANIEKCYANLMHNVIDAIGIGLWKLGRINKRSILND